MSDHAPEPSRGRVLLLETNAPLRSAITTILAAELFEVQRVDSLDEALLAATERSVALVAWQGMAGLLAEEHRDKLAELSRRLCLVVMVPRRWARLLEDTHLPSAVSGMISKPFEADELISAVQGALAQRLTADALTH